MDMGSMLNKMFGRIEPGLCRLSMNGSIAIKTPDGYKTYNVKTKRLTNCSNFVFNIGEEMFFVVPTNNVAVGDIILSNGKPKCVVEINDNEIVAINYESSTRENLIPERHVFMDDTYLYGKIVSMFGNMTGKKKKSKKTIFKYLMMSEMMKGMSGDSTTSYSGTSGNHSNFSSMLPMMFMMGSGGLSDTLIGDIFDFDDSDEDDCDEECNCTEGEE